MNCGCSICKNNKPFELPDEIVEAAIKGELVLFVEQVLVLKERMFCRFLSIRQFKKN